jgi:hypothetical protein
MQTETANPQSHLSKALLCVTGRSWLPAGFIPSPTPTPWMPASPSAPNRFCHVNLLLEVFCCKGCRVHHHRNLFPSAVLVELPLISDSLFEPVLDRGTAIRFLGFMSITLVFMRCQSLGSNSRVTAKKRHPNRFRSSVASSINIPSQSV